MKIINLGEGIAFAGITIGAALSKNYWLLILLLIPFFTWMKYDDAMNKENTEREIEEHDLKMEKLREEIRLLKVKKK